MDFVIPTVYHLHSGDYLVYYSVQSSANNSTEVSYIPYYISTTVFNIEIDTA